MYVVATAGHVDHGKSTLVRALTGMEPDRWAEERRRGMTIDLGFAWTELDSGRRIAFVDVPGHERFVPNMLAGTGPVPAAMLVVAADEGWMPQSAEHLAALNALEVGHGLLAVTRSDLADPRPATEEALAEIARTSLGAVAAVAVSSTTGAGLPALRAGLDRLAAGLPEPDLAAPVRLWVDRSFTVRGSGTVVTGTLAAGRVAVGDELAIGRTGRHVRIRGLQALGEPAQQVAAVARVAVNLRGVDRDELGRGDALLTPGRFHRTDVVDVRLHGDPVAAVPASLVLHVGAAAVPVRVRPLGPDTARLSLQVALPLRLGDRGLLRDPGRHHVVGGVTALDVAPPPLRRRGAAAQRAAVLAGADGRPDEAAELRRRRLVRRAELAAMGVPVRGRPVAGDWLADPEHWQALRGALAAAVAEHRATHPLEPGPTVETVRRRLDLPDRGLVEALVQPPLALREGRVVTGTGATGLPPAVASGVAALRRELSAAPFAAPEAARLSELGLGPRELAAAARAGELLRVGDAVVLLPGAQAEAAQRLAAIPAPFTLSEARRALGTTRRVAVPLLELLDRQGITARGPDDRRTVRRPATPPVAPPEAPAG
jgi:selenocysteine-specific elongation factor